MYFSPTHKKIPSQGLTLKKESTGDKKPTIQAAKISLVRSRSNLKSKPSFERSDSLIKLNTKEKKKHFRTQMKKKETEIQGIKVVKVKSAIRLVKTIQKSNVKGSDDDSLSLINSDQEFCVESDKYDEQFQKNIKRLETIENNSIFEGRMGYTSPLRVIESPLLRSVMTPKLSNNKGI